MKVRRELLELPVDHQWVVSSDGLVIGMTGGGSGLQGRDIALYPSRLVVMVLGVLGVVVVVVVVMMRMLMSLSKMVVVLVSLLVHGHRPGVRLKIASRVVVEPDKAITGNINIRHGSTLCTEELRW